MLRRSTSVCKLILGLRLWGMSTKECFIRMRSYTVPRTTARCGRVMRMESVVSMCSYLEHWLRPHKEVLSPKTAQLEGCRALVHETSWSIKVIGPIITRELSSVNSLPLKDVLETYHSSLQTGNVVRHDGLCKGCPNALDEMSETLGLRRFADLSSVVNRPCSKSRNKSAYFRIWQQFRLASSETWQTLPQFQLPCHSCV